jgi:hypothetical protein
LALVVAMLALPLVAGCHDDAPGDPTQAVTLVRVSGDGQHAPGLATLGPFEVRALDPVTSAPLGNVPVRFSIERRPAGGARLSDTLATTSRDGTARTELTLGADPVDSVVISARAGRAAPVRFTAFVSAAPVVRRIVPPLIRAGDTVLVFGTGLGIAADPGAIRFDGTPVRALAVSDTLVRVVAPACLASGPITVAITNGGARTAPVTIEYRVRSVPLALAPLDGRVLQAEQLSACVTLTGENSQYLVVAQFESVTGGTEPLDVEIGATGSGAGAAFARGMQPGLRDATPHAFEAVLRRRESTLSRAFPRTPGAQAVRAPAPLPDSGSVRGFSVISSLDASTFATVPTRLAYVGRHILVWIDTTSPPELPAAELQSLARVFDDDLYPLDQDAFGEPSDIDGNGRVDIVLTPVVNTLTPVTVCSLSGFVSGFFSAHDLYPASPNANGGEILYGFVPDSLGRYGCPHPSAEFSRVIRTTFVHELQHVINYQQHVLVRGGAEEDIWLNEGLSHMAEELASKVYERRYPAPLGRGSPEQLFPDSSQNFILYNMINAYLFLRQPYASSLTHFIEGGTLEERGGAWLFLRWLADQYGEGILRRLVQTSLHGTANVADRTGEPFPRLAGDFSLAVYADSLPGLPRNAVPARWRFQSRNLRVLFQRLNVIANFPPFPIETLAIPLGGSVHGDVRPGGFVMLTVQVPAGSSSVSLRFVPHSGAAWETGQFPQVSILRLQ